jgi:sugar (pentulose or hexulose) kinase
MLPELVAPGTIIGAITAAAEATGIPKARRWWPRPPTRPAK